MLGRALHKVRQDPEDALAGGQLPHGHVREGVERDDLELWQAPVPHELGEADERGKVAHHGGLEPVRGRRKDGPLVLFVPPEQLVGKADQTEAAGVLAQLCRRIVLVHNVLDEAYLGLEPAAGAGRLFKQHRQVVDLPDCPIPLRPCRGNPPAQEPYRRVVVLPNGLEALAKAEQLCVLLLVLAVPLGVLARPGLGVGEARSRPSRGKARLAAALGDPARLLVALGHCAHRLGLPLKGGVAAPRRLGGAPVGRGRLRLGVGKLAARAGGPFKGLRGALLGVGKLAAYARQGLVDAPDGVLGRKQARLGLFELAQGRAQLGLDGRLFLVVDVELVHVVGLLLLDLGGARPCRVARLARGADARANLLVLGELGRALRLDLCEPPRRGDRVEAAHLGAEHVVPKLEVALGVELVDLLLDLVHLGQGHLEAPIRIVQLLEGLFLALVELGQADQVLDRAALFLGRKVGDARDRVLPHRVELVEARACHVEEVHDLPAGRLFLVEIVHGLAGVVELPRDLDGVRVDWYAAVRVVQVDADAGRLAAAARRPRPAGVVQQFAHPPHPHYLRLVLPRRKRDCI